MASEPLLVEQAPEVGGRSRPRWSELKRATATVAIMTSLSRVLGLVREVLTSSYFGTSGRFSAFTIAFQIPNLVRNLVADSALSAAFLPVFTELIEQGRKREAFELASTLLWAVLLILGAATTIFILTATWIIPLFVGPTFSPALVHLTVGLARILFPMVILLGVNGLLVAILQTYGHFGLPAFGGVAWNVVTITVLTALRPSFHGGGQLYAYAIGVLAGTVVQFMIAVIALKGLDFRLVYRIKWRDSRIRQVLVLMLPVTIALGIFDVDSLINSVLGTLVSDQAPRAIAAAFQISMVPQGLVAIPISTVLFPTMSRIAVRGDLVELRRVIEAGLRQMWLLTIPAGALMVALATPIVRLIYQHGSFTSHSTHLVADALIWFAVSVPFAAAELLLTRAFFAIRRSWLPARIAAMNVIVDFVVSVSLYKPLGISGLVLGTAVASASMLLLQYHLLNRELGLAGNVGSLLISLWRIVAAAGLSGLVSWTVAGPLTHALGRSIPAEMAVLAVAASAGLLTFSGAVLVMGVAEARDVARAAARRLRR